ncbi:MAG TPA: zeta toxin family protein [Thermoanaerobaculia bacterium]|nr:zeta toxin family protein [Thermoanaerobaculia bacterium]
MSTRKTGRAIRELIATTERLIVVVAGSNGAGKTTFVETILHPLGIRVVNPDAIAHALFPDAPVEAAYEAARAADVVRADLVRRHLSFCTETVFSDREGAKLAFLRKARERGYTVILVFIGLASSDLAIARVMQRTEDGGHDVPDQKIRERFPRTLENLREALEFVDHAFLFDNSSAESPYRFVAELRSGRVVKRGTFRPRWWPRR